MTRCEAEKAFRESASEEFLHIPAENEIEHEFSEKFNRKMKKLLREVEYNGTHFLSKPQKRVLALVAVIIMLFAGIMSIGNIRKAVVEFACEAFGDSAFCESEDNIPKKLSINCWFITENEETVSLSEEQKKQNKERAACNGIYTFASRF